MTARRHFIPHAGQWPDTIVDEPPRMNRIPRVYQQDDGALDGARGIVWTLLAVLWLAVGAWLLLT